MKRSPLFLVDSVRISFKFQHQDGLKFSFEIYNRQVKNSGRVVWKEVFDVNCTIPLQMLLFLVCQLVGYGLENKHELINNFNKLKGGRHHEKKMATSPKNLMSARRLA